MPRPLGVVQDRVLALLRQYGYWHGRGVWIPWVWDTPRGTQRILDSLVKRGLARVVDREGTGPYYTPTR